MTATLQLVFVAFLIGVMLLGGLRPESEGCQSNNAVAPHIANTRELPQAEIGQSAFDQLQVPDFTKVVIKVMPAVVQVRAAFSYTAAEQYYRQLPDPFRNFFDQFFGPDFRFPEKDAYQHLSLGSGVIVREDGYVVTNHHLIDGADAIEVTTDDNQTYEAIVIGYDPMTDLALIKINSEDLVALPMVNSDEVQVGEWVLAVGNPFNLHSTVTAGIVSAKARSIDVLQGRHAIESFIQTDAAINPGNSGGPLVNLDGGLIGINTAIASPTGAYTGYGFAVPSNMVKKVLEDLLQYGTVQRGFLGVSVRNVDGQLAREKGLTTTTGVYVDSVMANSAAEGAGLLVGDIIVAVEGTPIGRSPQLMETIARHRPGDRLRLKIIRSGKSKTLSVTLRSLDGKETITRKELKTVLLSLGADFQPLSEEEAHGLGIEGGVRITKLHAGKLRRDTNMEEGFIITHVNRKPVSSLEDLADSLEGEEGGILIAGRYEHDSTVMYFGLGISG